MKRQDEIQLRAYYAARAQEYEAIYAKPERQADLRELESRLPAYFKGRRTLEVACGTGYWSRFIAPAASELLALDASIETLEIARGECGNDRAVLHPRLVRLITAWH